MPHYYKLGNIPHKRHTQFRKPDGTLYSEQLFSTEGFSDDYALLYARNYGAEESVVELIPYMLEAFLKADAAFRTGRKELQDVPRLPIARRRYGKGSKTTDTTNKENT